LVAGIFIGAKAKANSVLIISHAIEFVPSENRHPEAVRLVNSVSPIIRHVVHVARAPCDETRSLIDEMV
jgi:hypothetical protein